MALAYRGVAQGLQMILFLGRVEVDGFLACLNSS